MNTAYKLYPLSDLIRRNGDIICLDPNTEYRELTVKLWGKGIIQRGIVKGIQIAAKQRHIAHKGQLILSRIDARNGAIGIIPNEIAEAIVSNDFPVYDIDDSKLSSAYLGWLCKTGSFVEKCRQASEGTTNRVRIQEDKFLSIQIPLPPLPEQRRIVARIEELAGKIDIAKALRNNIQNETGVLFSSIVDRVFSKFKSCPHFRLKEIATKIGSGSTPLGGRASYPEVGIPFIRSLNVHMRQFTWDRIAYISSQTHSAMSGTQVKPHDVLLNITGASIGRVACVPPNLKEGNVNQHVAIVRPTDRLCSRYLMYWISQPTIQDYINSEQKGATRQGFTKKQIEGFNIPLPPISMQNQVIDELDAVNSRLINLQRLQAETTAELDALLPSILDKAFNGEL